MEQPIITIENVGKKYDIRHQRGNYVALRDVLMNIIKRPFRFLKQKAKQVAGLETKEEFWALKGIDLKIKKGEVIGIIGRNGAGKSTMLKILSQITPPTEGEIRVNGRVGSLLEVGTGFHPELTGRENIFLNAAILGMTRKEIALKFDRIVEFAGIEKFLDTPVKYYSSGMYVRLAFSVAAYLEPDILIVDEVLAVGDAEFQKKCLGRMDEIAKTDERTIIFVSHNMAAIRHLCGRTIWLDQGKMKMIGATDQVVTAYLNSGQNDLSPEGQILYRDTDLGITLRKLDLCNDRGEKIPALITSKKAIMKMEVESKDHWDQVAATIGINTWLENFRVGMFYSPLTGKDLYLEPGLNRLSCQTPNFPLRPGQYRLTLKLVAAGKVLFYLPEVVKLRVESDGSIAIGDPSWASWLGTVAFDQSWSNESEGNE